MSEVKEMRVIENEWVKLNEWEWSPLIVSEFEWMNE
jgi:hypothetical protein